MPSLVIVGAQWGDEGKGKIVDAVAEKADIVVRFQGGDNAGHTVWHAGQKHVLHILPSGILRKRVLCVIGGGVVINPEKLISELQAANVPESEWKKRLRISAEAHLILPCHVAMDKANEKNLGVDKIGTTLRGIGPAYADRAARIGVRMGDILSVKQFELQLKRCLNAKKKILKKQDLDSNGIIEKILPLTDKIKHLICDSSLILSDAYKAGKNILFEGAQGAMLDVGAGTYPFVTSSHTIAGGAAVGAGVGPHCIDKIFGITKAYTTRVGEGPFPTELNDKTGEKLRENGGEYGATTGRPRRCGWLDLVAMKRAVRLNSLDGIILTKLDVLDHFDEIGVCVAYEYSGKKLKEWPLDPAVISKIKPVYKFFKGWSKPTSAAKSFKTLPDAAKKYIAFIERQLETPVTAVSAGVDRSQLIVRQPFF